MKVEVDLWAYLGQGLRDGENEQESEAYIHVSDIDPVRTVSSKSLPIA